MWFRRLADVARIAYTRAHDAGGRPNNRAGIYAARYRPVCDGQVDGKKPADMLAVNRVVSLKALFLNIMDQQGLIAKDRVEMMQ